MIDISSQMKYRVLSKGNITFSTQSRENRKGLLVTCPCSPGLPTQGARDAGGPHPTPTPALGPGIQGLAASKCCYQPFLIIPRLGGKSDVPL